MVQKAGFGCNFRRCEYCGDTFTPYRDSQRFCPGGECRQAHHTERRNDEAALRRWWLLPTRDDIPPGQIEADHYHRSDLGHVFRTRGQLVAHFEPEWLRLVVEESAASELDASLVAGLL